MPAVDSELINGRYRLRQEIGRGETGGVYLGDDEALGRQVAIKVLETTEDAERQERRFEREIATTSQLQHPGIVTVFDRAETGDGRRCYVMSLARGRTLEHHLDKLRAAADPWGQQSLLERIGLFLKLTQIIDYAHSRGVVHRDLKPGNIMLGQYGEVWVLDWGLARDVREEVGELATDNAVESAYDELFESGTKRGAATVILPVDGRPAPAPGPTRRVGGPAVTAALRPTMRQANGTTTAPTTTGRLREERSTRHGELLGSPGYMSPEQAGGRADSADRRSDIYSLGVILYELMTLRLPVELADDEAIEAMLDRVRLGKRAGMAERWPEAPRGLVDICEWALATDPGDRYPDCEMFAAELRTLLAQLAESYAEHERGRLAREREGAWTPAGDWDFAATPGLGPFTEPNHAVNAEPVGQVMHPELGGLLIGGWGLQIYPLAIALGDDVRVEIDFEVVHGHELWLFLRGVPPQPSYQFRIGAYGGRWMIIARGAGADPDPGARKRSGAQPLIPSRNGRAVLEPEILTLRPLRDRAREAGHDTTRRHALGRCRAVVEAVGQQLSLTIDGGDAVVVQDTCPLSGPLNRQLAVATWESHAVVHRVAVSRRRSPLMQPAYAIGNELLKQNLFPQAIGEYRRFLAMHGDAAAAAEARFMLCLTWLRSGQLSQAERDLRAFLADHLEHALAQDAIFELARLEMAKSRSVERGVRVVLSYQESGDFVRARFALTLAWSLGERLRGGGLDDAFVADLERVKLLVRGSPDFEPMRGAISLLLSARAREHLFMLLDREAHDAVVAFRGHLARIDQLGFPLRGVDQLSAFEHLDVARTLIAANDPGRTRAALARESGALATATWLRDCLSLIAVGCGAQLGAALADDAQPLALLVTAGLRAQAGDDDAAQAALMRCFAYTDRIETDRSDHVMVQSTRIGCYALGFIPFELVWETLGADAREPHLAPFAALVGWLAECLARRDDARTAWTFLLAEGSGFAVLARQALARLA